MSEEMDTDIKSSSQQSFDEVCKEHTHSCSCSPHLHVCASPPSCILSCLHQSHCHCHCHGCSCLPVVSLSLCQSPGRCPDNTTTSPHMEVGNHAHFTSFCPHHDCSPTPRADVAAATPTKQVCEDDNTHTVHCCHVHTTICSPSHCSTSPYRARSGRVLGETQAHAHGSQTTCTLNSWPTSPTGPACGVNCTDSMATCHFHCHNQGAHEHRQNHPDPRASSSFLPSTPSNQPAHSNDHYVSTPAPYASNHAPYASNHAPYASNQLTCSNALPCSHSNSSSPSAAINQPNDSNPLISHSSNMCHGHHSSSNSQQRHSKVLNYSSVSVSTPATTPQPTSYYNGCPCYECRRSCHNQSLTPHTPHSPHAPHTPHSPHTPHAPHTPHTPHTTHAPHTPLSCRRAGTYKRGRQNEEDREDYGENSPAAKRHCH